MAPESQLQIRSELDLLEKTLRAEHRREFGVQNLDGDAAAVTHVFGEIDSRHAAGSELALEHVAAFERGP